MATMEIVTCPSTEDFVQFNGGMIAVRAAAYIGPARGTLSEVVSAEAMSGSYVEDTQTVPWGGVNHFEALDFTAADDTIVIDPADLPLEAGFLYVPFATVRLQGTAGAGDGRRHENFWNYDSEIFEVFLSENDFASVSMGLGTLPRSQSQFSLVQFSSGTLFYDPDFPDPWSVRAVKRATSGGTVAIQIEQLIFAPLVSVPVGRYTAIDFRFSTTTDGDFPTESAAEPSLDNGIFTMDRAQPLSVSEAVGMDDLQDNDGDDPEVSVIDYPPHNDMVGRKSVLHVAAGIVHPPKVAIEDDDFGRTVTMTEVGTGDEWGDSPYGYQWDTGNDALGIGMGASTVQVGVNGSAGVIDAVQDNTVNVDSQDVSNNFWMMMEGRSESTGGGPSNSNARDLMIEAQVELDALPTVTFEIDVGAFTFLAGVEAGVSAFTTARVVVDPGGDLNLYFAFHYYTQVGPLQIGPDSLPAGITPIAQTWGGPISVGTYTPGDILHIKFARRAYNLYARVWDDADPEPSTWDLEDRMEIPYDDGGTTILWDSYPYAQVYTMPYAWSFFGRPGLRAYTDPDDQDPGIVFYCHNFKVDYWQDEDAEFDPTDVWLQVNEAGTATVLGDPLNLEWKSQNWVVVDERVWTDVDLYQWNDPDSIPLQWSSTGTTFYRVYHRFIPQIYRRIFG